MIKHRLMLSAAAAALLTAALAVAGARADTEISTATGTELNTATGGNILIDAAGAINISKSSVPVVTLNSANSVINNGGLSNTADGGMGVVIDTTAGNLLSTGFASTGTIDLSAGGTDKRGILIQGGHTFYGPITLTSLATVTLTGAITTTQSSAMAVQGDGSAAFLLFQGTTVTSNILLAGGGISQSASVNSTASDSVIVDLDGTLNGNLIIASSLSGVGPGITGVQTLGGIHSCASDTTKPSGFTCPTSSGGAFINAGQISLIGINFFNSRGNNPEAGSAIVIGGSIDGGFINTGPGTASNVSAALITSAGLASAPVILIDPARSATSNVAVPRGPVIIGPVTADVDAIDPGYSFINRGSISARPIDSEISTAAVVIQGASPVNFTCLGTSVSATSCVGGGLLNTGAISAQAGTAFQTVSANGPTSATGLYIGAYATVPRLDVISETISSGSTTPGTISGAIGGVGQGNAFGVFINENASVPVVNVGKGASITASVTTSTIAPTKSIAPATSPFTLISRALVDLSGTLKTVNNAGLIQASNTVLVPGIGASAISIANAIDLKADTSGGITINNSGRILGDNSLGGGSGNTFNVGNTGGGGTTANATGVLNTSSNYAVVAQSVITAISGQAPLTQAGLIDFGSLGGHTLHVGGFGYVNAVINSGSNALAVQVDPNGQLFIANTTTSLEASSFNVGANGTLGLAISQSNLNNANTPVVHVAQGGSADISGAILALQFGTYISSGITAASTNFTGAGTGPTAQTVTLLSAPVIVDTTLATQNAVLGLNTPFLFETPAESGLTPLSIDNTAGRQTLSLHLLPRSTGAKNADNSPGLNLSAAARNEFPFAAHALSNDDELGAAIATGMTVYNTAGLPGSGINVAASQQQAQQLFSQFAPDVSGGTREIAILITDQASGPVAARQRLLRSYANQPGDMTLWGEEFTGQVSNKGRVASDGTLTSFKDHGFGFTLGLDGGSPRNGWYGGAFTFYSGDVTQQLPRATRTNTQWYMLSGYTDWRGKHVFLDTQISAAYGNFEETRVLNVGSTFRTATSRRPGAMLALGANTGVMLHYSGIEVDPHISLDGMTLREEGYLEANGGPGFNLDVAPYFATSLRTAIGADFKTKITVWDFDLTPEARLGYRYDLLHQPVKIKAAFQSTGGRGTAGNTMTFVGPDPDTGNAIVGLGLGASTDTWQLGVNYDWIRGNNGSTTQVGIITVLGRI